MCCGKCCCANCQEQFLLQGKVVIDGYSRDVIQPQARRTDPDHTSETPADCLAHGTDHCEAGHPSLVLNEKDMVDHGERARKLTCCTRALQAAQQGRGLSAGLIFHPVFCGALSTSVPVSIVCSTIRTKRDLVQIHLTVSYSEIWVTIVWHQLNLN
jgi:hypothetical protein